MIDAIPAYQTELASLPQKLKSSFTSDQGLTIYLEYNGLQGSFRVRRDTVQRLFFFEKEGLQKTAFRNEYGVLLGQLVPTKRFAGWLRIDRKKYRFELNEDARLFLFHTRTNHLMLTCPINQELLLQNGDSRHLQNVLYCLVFAFAWMLE